MSLNSCGGMTPVTPTTPGGSRNSIPDGAPRISRCASSEEEEDPDFLNFSYNNLATLMQRNLELADDAQNTPRGSRCSAAGRRARSARRRARCCRALGPVSEPIFILDHARCPEVTEQPLGVALDFLYAEYT